MHITNFPYIKEEFATCKQGCDRYHTDSLYVLGTNLLHASNIYEPVFSYGRGRSRSLIPCPTASMFTLTSCLACTVRL
jgi:hypothetical protein